MHCARQATFNIDHNISCRGNANNSYLARIHTHKEPTKLINFANNLPQIIIIIGNSSTPIRTHQSPRGRRLKSNADRSWPSSRLNSDMLARAAEEKAAKRARRRRCRCAPRAKWATWARRVARGRFQPQLLNGRFVNADGNEPRSLSLKRLHDAQLNQFMRLLGRQGVIRSPPGVRNSIWERERARVRALGAL